MSTGTRCCSATACRCATWVSPTSPPRGTTPTSRRASRASTTSRIRRLGDRNLDHGQKFARDRDLLLAEVERNPEDARSVYFLAQSYLCLGDFVNALKWYQRRVLMGGWDEEIYFAMYRIAELMSQLGAPWPEVQDAYLRAWEFRPTRAEPLYAIARHYRDEQRYRLGYQFAKLAAEIPYPEHDVLVVRADIYAWRATDEQAVCASWIDKQAEAFTLWRRLLTRPDVPDEDRQTDCRQPRRVCARPCSRRPAPTPTRWCSP